MKKISSGGLFWQKRIFPIIWFGFLAFFLISTFLNGNSRKVPLPFLLFPMLMAALGYFFMKKLVWDLADVVYDCGDFLIIRRAGEEEQVPLANIMNVSASTMTNPPRITLRLVTPGKFGTEIAFSPERKFTFNPFARNQVAEDLIVRVDQARRRA